MTQIKELTQDAKAQHIRNALASYVESHPKARIDVRPRYKTLLGIRVIDPDFNGRDRLDREPEVWRLLDVLPDDVYTSITTLLLLTPSEVKRSGANVKFEEPTPSEF